MWNTHTFYTVPYQWTLMPAFIAQICHIDSREEDQVYKVGPISSARLSLKLHA